MTETRGGSVATTDPQPQPAAGGRGSRGHGPVAGLSLYYRQVVAELRKVIWPTRHELITYTIVALIFVTVMVTIVAVLDVLFAKGVLQVFG
ncbi:MAG: preprotein translocase subunit SecE [Frankiaceae bacterium]